MPPAKTKKPAPKKARSTQSIKSEWRHEFSSGGVIFHGKGGAAKILLIKDSYGRWGLPKGRIEKGETPEQAALRECSEETGIPLKDLKVIEHLGEVKYVYQLHGKKIFKTVVFFLVESSSTKLTHQWEVQDAQWFGTDDAYKTIEYKNTKKIMKKALARLKEP